PTDAMTNNETAARHIPRSLSRGRTMASSASRRKAGKEPLEPLHDDWPAVLAVDVRASLAPQTNGQVPALEQPGQRMGELVVIPVEQRAVGAQRLSPEHGTSCVDEGRQA